MNHTIMSARIFTWKENEVGHVIQVARHDDGKEKQLLWTTSIILGIVSNIISNSSEYRLLMTDYTMTQYNAGVVT